MYKRFMSLLLLMFVALQVVGYCHVGEVSCYSDNLAEAYSLLKAKGFSDVAASAIVGNIASESGGDPAKVEGGDKGRGIGIFQASNDANRQTLEDYCSGPEHESHEKVTLSPARAPKSYVVCNRVDCQIEAILPGMASTVNARNWSTNYNDKVRELSTLSQGVVDGLIPAQVDIVQGWEGFKSQEDLYAATIQFLCDYETPSSTSCCWVGLSSYNDSVDVQNGFISSIQSRYDGAKRAYEEYGGLVAKPMTPPVVEEAVVEVVEEPVAEVVAEQVEEVAEEPVETETVLSAVKVMGRSAPQKVVAITPEIAERVNKQESTTPTNSGVVIQFVMSMFAISLTAFALLICMQTIREHLGRYLHNGIMLRTVEGHELIFSICDYMALEGYEYMRVVSVCCFAVVVDYMMIVRLFNELFVLMY